MSQGTITLDDEVLKNRHVSPIAAFEHAKMAQRVLAITAIPLTDWRTWDALATNLPGTPAADDLGVTTGTYGTNVPYVSTGDLKAAGSTTRRAAAVIALPNDYEAAETVQIRVYAGMVTTVADVAATVDVECWRLDKDGTLGAADLCSTAAQSINSLTAAAKDFTITATTLIPGDQLYVRLTVLVNDAATATAVIGAVWQAELLSDLR